MLKILAEEKDFIIVNKPAGLIVHSDGKKVSVKDGKTVLPEKTLCDFLLEKYPEIEKVGENLQIKINFKNKKTGEIKTDHILIKKPGIVHRLDRETSGVMIIARNQKFFEHIKSQFKKHEIKKVYHAFVYGNIIEDSGKIDAPIGRSKKDFRRWFSGDDARGEKRDALTEFKVLKRSSDKSVTFVEVYPKTGRTHQIRVHFKHIYRPLVADELYAPGRIPVLGFNRVALHAKSIEFTDLDGQKRIFESEYPEDFRNAVSAIMLD